MTGAAISSDRAESGGFRSVAAETGQPEGEAFPVHGPADVAAACAAAEAAFDIYRATGREERAAFLERIADEIMGIGDDLIVAAMRESGLPRARLEGERGRTTGQLRLFANVVRAGAWLGLRIDPALPDRQPLPRPDIRLRMIPLGPVAVFGASNFPLAFSTAGGDTASALAAGCPVVVKGHPAHPETGALVAAAIARAVAASGLPEGVFSHLVGPGNDLGAALVQDPRIAAVGFTGSRGGGLALMKLAQARPVPIPVYAEMSSINPVLLLPEALKARGQALGQAFVGSLTMGAGQFCTNPGLILAIEGEGLDAFVAAATEGVGGADAQVMLTTGIHDAFEKGTAALAGNGSVETLARGREGNGCTRGQAALFQTTASAFLADKALGHEVFGASSIIVRCRDEAELRTVLAGLEGQLTATLHMDAADEAIASRLLPLLERKVGRILANGWPTGVEVCHAMVHGGPFPATSDARTTSVGSLAIDRFLRPVSYQNLAQALLPAELGDAAAGDGVPRLVDGVLTTG
ncbi:MULTISPECIES: aldehyde dehydrogenase (NADP(+)) [Sphingomonas]|uniref:Aldehyde dehydrogenase (NADP(+)) n=1 Tax=Edaphosphingomonas fennica TaxID=114404 RepID=A0A2T4HLK8_9SPHN|nr:MULTISPECIES: aldehyde dehydrogenase (NADP(+)) [Sphingomonas]AGH49019.1 aldehyde dehydrogenase [Sphingomonas sp. MM-1]PTD16694.1 aldehyde dehydrogenase (NADP(+)) [Sphingomonas fennica]